VTILPRRASMYSTGGIGVIDFVLRGGGRFG
jgi:hypothetical protein